jgi:HEPN domain-containing protein
MPDAPEPVRQWIKKAEGDLRSAQLLLAADPPEPDAVAFHAQQAVEKYLKAYLVHLGIDPPRTHDLITLFDLIAPHDDNLEPLRESGRSTSAPRPSRF